MKPGQLGVSAWMQVFLSEAGRPPGEKVGFEVGPCWGGDFEGGDAGVGLLMILGVSDDSPYHTA